MACAATWFLPNRGRRIRTRCSGCRNGLQPWLCRRAGLLANAVASSVAGWQPRRALVANGGKRVDQPGKLAPGDDVLGRGGTRQSPALRVIRRKAHAIRAHRRRQRSGDSCWLASRTVHELHSRHIGVGQRVRRHDGDAGECQQPADTGMRRRSGLHWITNDGRDGHGRRRRVATPGINDDSVVPTTGRRAQRPGHPGP